jgi:hypothetical protein
LPDGIGLRAPLEIAQRLNAAGDLFAVLTDITRCFGRGDIVVVASGNPLPLTLELKSSLVESGVVEIDFLSPYAETGPLRDLFDRVCHLLDLKARGNGAVNARIQRQVDELLEGARFSARLARNLAEQAPPPDTNHWTSIRKLLERVFLTGASFDVFERGVVAIGVRLQPDDDSHTALLSVAHRAKDLSGDRPVSIISSVDAMSTDALAVLVPPIPLWPLPGDLRNALLAGKLYLAMVVDENVWDEAFSTVGVTRTVGDDGWLLEKEGNTARLDLMETYKLTVGIGFAGFSPRAIARAAVIALDRGAS